MSDGESPKTGGGAGTNEFENLHEIIRKTRRNLTQEAWDTLVGAPRPKRRSSAIAWQSTPSHFRPRVQRQAAKRHHLRQTTTKPIVTATAHMVAKIKLPLSFSL